MLKLLKKLMLYVLTHSIAAIFKKIKRITGTYFTNLGYLRHVSSIAAEWPNINAANYQKQLLIRLKNLFKQSEDSSSFNLILGSRVDGFLCSFVENSSYKQINLFSESPIKDVGFDKLFSFSGAWP